MSAENEIQEERNQGEQYEIWKQNVPFIWPSLTVTWLNDIEIDQNNNEVHKLIVATQTDGQEQEFINVLKIQFPQQAEEEFDASVLNNIWKTQSVGKITQESQIPVQHDINKIRQQPMSKFILAAQTSVGEISIYDINKQQKVMSLKGQEREGYGLSWNPKTQVNLLSASYDTKIYNWDVGTGQLIRSYNFHLKEVEDVCWHPQDPNLFISCSDDKTFAICDTRTQYGMKIKQEAHSQEVNCIQFNQLEPKYFATGSNDAEVKMFDITKPEKQIYSFSNHDDAIYTLQWSPHKKNLLATGSVDSKIILWDYLKVNKNQEVDIDKDGPPEVVFYHGGHRSKVNDLSWNPNHKNLIASVEADKNMLQVWKIQSGLWMDEENDDLIQSLV